MGISKERLEGQKARAQGKPLSSNPYGVRKIVVKGESWKTARARGQWRIGWKSEDDRRRVNIFALNAANKVPFAVVEAMETAISMNADRGPQWQAKYALTAMTEAFEMIANGEDPCDMPMLKQ